MAFFHLSIICLLVLSSLANSIAHRHQHHYNNNLKSLHFTLYLQETFNRTAYFIVKGVAGPKGITKISNPFGTLFAFHDPLTVSPDPSSKVLGSTEGSAVTSSFDGQRTMAISKFNLNLNNGYKGSLLNVGVADYLKASELPMVGGTGDFRYVQGYIITSPVDLSKPTTVYRIDFHLYWPPFAAMITN